MSLSYCDNIILLSTYMWHNQTGLEERAESTASKQHICCVEQGRIEVCLCLEHRIYTDIVDRKLDLLKCVY